MSLDMFAIDLRFYLNTSAEPADVEAAIQAAFSGRSWGVEEDLMKAKEEWAEALLVVTGPPPPTADEPAPPIFLEVNFLVFPDRVRGKHDLMLPTALAMLRDLSLRFECPVFADATEHHPEKKRPESEPYRSYTPPPESSFLMQGGVLYTCAWRLGDALEGAAQPGDWLPVGDVPDLRLDERGRLVDPAAMVEAYWAWRAGRAAPPPIPPERIRALYAGTVIGEGPPDTGAWEDDDPDATPWDPLPTLPGEDASSAPTDTMDAYFKQVDAYVEGRGATSAQRLIERGVLLPAPDSMDDETLHAKLAELIDALAAQQTYVHTTNHLSDRELYTDLWSRSLNETSMNLAGIPGASCNIDMLGGCSEEDMRLQLIHYAKPRDRAREAANWPEHEIPAHVPPAFDRDRHLPKPMCG